MKEGKREIILSLHIIDAMKLLFFIKDIRNTFIQRSTDVHSFSGVKV